MVDTTEPLTQLQISIDLLSTNCFDVNDPVYDAFYTQAMATTTLDGVKTSSAEANEYCGGTHICHISTATDDFQFRSAVAQRL